MGNENKIITQKDSLPIYLFHQGTNFRAYDFLGVHREEDDGKIKYYFRVWAPNAKNVSLCSSFTDWEDGLSMQRVNKEGIWELLIESDKPLEGEFYKYRVVGKNGQAHMKADPYAFESETLKKTASIIFLLFFKF